MDKDQDLNAISLLPSELISETDMGHEALKGLEKLCKEYPYHKIINLSDLYQILEVEEPESISKKELVSLPAFLEALNFGIIPDFRHHNIKIDLNSEIVVFPYEEKAKFVPSKRFDVLYSITRLGAIMSRADGEIHEEEIRVIENFINTDNTISALEKQYLNEFVFWCLKVGKNEALSTTGLKPYIKDLSKEEKKHIAEFLILVLYADHKVHIEEVKKLEKFYKLLDLDSKNVYSDIHKSQDLVNTLANEPAEGASGTKVPAHPIISKHKSIRKEASESTKLDPNKLKVIREDTIKSHASLGDIFKSNEDEEIEDARQHNETEIAKSQGLDATHANIVKQIIQKDSWEREELIKMFDENRLMFDENKLMFNATVDKINEWAIENYEDNLIFETGDMMEINEEIKEQIQNI